MNLKTMITMASLAPLLVCGDGMAEEMREENAPASAIEEIVVTGVKFRNRTESTAPVLSYDLEYFQRFEPLTAGDALKRVPSVQFLSDVLESDGARLRGLDPGYTQILINGEKVPGAGVDRSFFIDRIPAELIERVEVVRSNSANRSGDAVSGALNIVLRDAHTLNGGYLRAGGIHLDDGRIRETLGGVYGGQVGPGRLLVGANIQGRRNPKNKLSLRYDEPGGSLDNSEVQTDVRDGRDYSANASYALPVAGGELELTGVFVRTDRLEDEDSIEYANGVQTGTNLLTTNANDVDILTDNWSLDAKYTAEMFGGKTNLKFGYAALNDRQDEVEEEIEFLDDNTPFPDDDVFGGTFTRRRLNDDEIIAHLSHQQDLAGITAEAGLQFNKKNRDTNIVEDENEADIDDPPAPRPVIPGIYGPFSPVAGGVNTIEERRVDPYIMFSGGSSVVKWEAGLRYETTNVRIVDETAPVANRVSKNDYDVLLPSAHLRWNVTPRDRVSLSAARSLRRPNFNDISPATLEGEFGENDFLGNPALKPEKAWGFDIGYEHYLGTRGVVGVNFFYRKVTDVIETINTGVEGSEGEDTFVLSRQNSGDGKVYGVEFDLSTPLTAFGLADTGIFVNASWLDSEITDFMGNRRFNDQTNYVINAGFIQDLAKWGAAFGVTYRKQGSAFGRVVAEEVTTTYGADLEVFVEKRFGEKFVLRFTGSNLLDARKNETFHKFDTIGDQLGRDYDEFELETEHAGPVFQLVARYAF